MSLRPPPFRGMSSRARRLTVVVAAVLLTSVTAWAGHEMTFYPSFYPHEITLKPLDRTAAARALEKTDVQAHLGADPFGGR